MSARPGRVSLCSLLGLLLVVAGAGRARAANDATIFALIDTLKPLAEAIVIDGQGGDWVGIPTFADPTGDAGGDPSQDITGVAIAPLDAALLIRIDTAAAPPATGRVFWILFDFVGQQYFDVKLSFNLDFTDDLDVFPEGQAPPPRVGWEGVTVAVGSVVEARIPYAALDAQLPASMQGVLSGAGARPWVRLKATTGEPFFSEVDHGSAVASFRLVDTPYTLDPALPAGAEGPVETPLPLTGRWYVGQGTHGFGSHQNIPWAYDLHQTDNALLPENPPNSSDNDDNYSFGEAILAPVAGTVFSTHDGEIDQPAHTCCAPGPPNWLFMEIPGDVGLLFSHARQGTVAFGFPDPIPADAVVAEVGHSGSSTWPHLHYEAQDISQGFASLPVAFAAVEVGLNPGANDPWRRRLSSWQPREGFFVERAWQQIPAAGPLALAALGALLCAFGKHALRRPRSARVGTAREALEV